VKGLIIAPLDLASVGARLNANSQLIPWNQRSPSDVAFNRCFHRDEPGGERNTRKNGDSFQSCSHRHGVGGELQIHYLVSYRISTQYSVLIAQYI
jgi:hypothetical protein